MAKEKGFLCFFRNRCGMWDSGCVRERATVENCVFIRVVETEKGRITKELLEILNKKGVISYNDPLYLRVKAGVKNLILDELKEAESIAINQCVAAANGEKNGQKQGKYYFAK